jgi:hypothetical protein
VEESAHPAVDYAIMIAQMKYSVEITETLQRVVEVEADGAADAERIASDKYRQGQIILDDTCCVDVVVRSLNPEAI